MEKPALPFPSCLPAMNHEGTMKSWRTLRAFSNATSGLSALVLFGTGVGVGPSPARKTTLKSTQIIGYCAEVASFESQTPRSGYGIRKRVTVRNGISSCPQMGGLQTSTPSLNPRRRLSPVRTQLTGQNFSKLSWSQPGDLKRSLVLHSPYRLLFPWLSRICLVW